MAVSSCGPDAIGHGDLERKTFGPARLFLQKNSNVALGTT